MQDPVPYVNQPHPESLTGVKAPLIQIPRLPPKIYNGYHSKRSFGLGVTQICVGILCMIFNAVEIAIAFDAIMYYFGQGIWSGVFFILAGSFGISAARVKSRCKIVTCMVLSILSAGLAIGVVLLFSAAALGMRSFMCYIPGDLGGYRDNDVLCKGDTWRALTAMDAMLLLLALVEGIVAIWSSAICCAAVCCCSRPSQGQVVQVKLPILQSSQTAGQPQVVCLTRELQGVGYLQQPLQGIQQQSLYPNQQQPILKSLQVVGPQATEVKAPPPYEQHPAPQQQTKTSA